eukprot:gnl/MRDRNA2_/MRDRNA2_107198_c0_seq1.p1 gnl/MRDRNA2_/MRDRNA2_107198_c0~~gnl/MRDRNA2_/MRDRNA2_107198_c0_seq1.p1  ORF type:complete len:168 (+),score=35.66 gnl/MRDRNA2_/MRDRNA2_107198_c0_seq1:76-579(+)
MTFQLEGNYLFNTQDRYDGQLNIYGKPKGKGILYYYDSGECDAGNWKDSGTSRGLPTHTGTGARFSKDREEAWKIVDGQKEEKISIDEALEVTGLLELPNKRNTDTIPPVEGNYESENIMKAEREQIEAWYNFRMLAGMPVNESPYGPDPYAPHFKIDSPYGPYSSS